MNADDGLIPGEPPQPHDVIQAMVATLSAYPNPYEKDKLIRHLIREAGKALRESLAKGVCDGEEADISVCVAVMPKRETAE